MSSPTSTPTPSSTKNTHHQHHQHHQHHHSPHHTYDPDHPPKLRRESTTPSSSSISSSITSGTGYFTFPVAYSVNGLLRRLSGDTTPTSGGDTSMPRKKSAPGGTMSSSIQSSLPKSLSSSFSSWTAGHRSPAPSNASSPSSSLYTPAPIPRTVSPFQPPPLTPLTLRDPAAVVGEKAGDGRILSTTLAEEIRLLVPARLQLVEEWGLVFGLERDGVSLATLYDKVEAYSGKRGGFVLVIKDESGGVRLIFFYYFISSTCPQKFAHIHMYTDIRRIPH
jgi:hypothetical protein